MITNKMQKAFQRRMQLRLALLFVLTLLIAFAAAAPTAARADAYTTHSGFITQLRLLTSPTQQAGEDAVYKVGVNKAGRLTAVLTDVASGEKTTIFYRNITGKAGIKLVVPGKLLQENRAYKLTVQLVRSGQVIGEAEGRLSTKPVTAQVTALTATPTFDPSQGNACTISFALADPGNIYAQVLDGSGKVVATLANNLMCPTTSGTFTWSGITDQKTIASNGDYTVRLWVVNAAGTSAVQTAHTRLTGTAVAVVGEASGTISAAIVRERPLEGVPLTVTLNATEPGTFIIKIRDTTAGVSLKRMGALNVGANNIVIDNGTFIIGGHSYLCQAVSIANGRTAGKAQLRFSGQADPPTASGLSLGALKPGFGMSMPINFNVKGSGALTIRVLDSQGKVVAVPASGVSPNAGANTIYWNGRGLQNTFLEAGDYTLTLVVSNAAGSSAVLSQSFTYPEVDSALPAVGTAGSLKVCTLLTDPELAERTPIRIFVRCAEAGTLKIGMRNNDTGAKSSVYNSKISAGDFTITIPGIYLSSGNYTLDVNLVNLAGKTTGKGRLALSPKRLSPAITDFSCPASFETGKNDVISLNITTRSSGYMTVEVFNSANQSVRTVIKRRYASSGTQSVSWDGRDNNQALLPDGVYTIACTYADPYGEVSGTVKRTITLTRVANPVGVYGTAVVGVGKFDTRINIYSAPGGRVITYTYAISATFTVLEDHGEYLYVQACRNEGAPVRGFVLASQVEKRVITSPYRIEISISRKGSRAQKLKLYKDNQLVDSFSVSTGLLDGSTPTGTFLILNRIPYFFSGDMRCEHALRVCGGVCIHRVPEQDGSYHATTLLLGSPASHGCIRVPVEKSEWLYKNIPDTTPVVIYYG